MKGVSPLLASVLLIGFTIAVGGLLSVWLTGFTRTTTSSVETAATNQTRCAGAYIKFDRVDSSNIIYSNPSVESITSITLTGNGGETISLNKSYPYTNVTSVSLSSGAVLTGNWTRSGSTKIIAKGLCRINVPVEGTCSSTDNCWY